MHAQHATSNGLGHGNSHAAAVAGSPGSATTVPGAPGSTGAVRHGPAVARSAAREALAGTVAEAILLPRRAAAVPSATALGVGAAATATLEPQLLLWAAGDTAAAEAWGRSLLGEGLRIECRSLAPCVLDASPGVESDVHARPPTQAIALHVADALAPQLPQLRALRARWPQLPLLAVVCGLRDLDQVLALEMGADDVIDAAVAAPVVAARLRALWRRATVAAELAAGGEREPPRELRFGALRLRRLERQVLLADVPVPLTEGEFEVLWLLASHAGQAMSRRDILKRVRGLDDQPLDRSIDSRVYRIRAKLGDGAAAQSAAARIRTVRHQGYAFSPTGW